MTARADFHAAREANRGLIEGLTRQIAILENNFEGDGGRDYGYVGSLQKVNADLLDLYRFLTGDEDATATRPEFSVPMRDVPEAPAPRSGALAARRARLAARRAAAEA